MEYELALGGRLLAAGQVDAALARYRYVKDATAAAGMQRFRVAALGGAARCRRAQGDTAAALELLREAARVWENTRAAPLDREWREQQGSTGRLIYTELAMLLIVGGNDTTRNSISGGVLALNENPAQYEKLMQNPGLLPKMVP